MDENAPKWDNRDPETGRHQRNGHILYLAESDWKCEKCGHQFDAASDAELFVCGESCAGKHRSDRVLTRPLETLEYVQRFMGRSG